MKHTGKEAYTIVVVTLVIGFILLLTTGIYNLVLGEMKHNRILGDYFKTYAGAESAQEMALFEIKEKGYAAPFSDTHSGAIGSGKLQPSIAYFHDGVTTSYSGSLASGKHDIIPLFTIDTGGKENVITGYKLESGNTDDILWSIVNQESGLVGNSGSLDEGIYKSYTENGNEIELKRKIQKVEKFLKSSVSPYLIVFNKGTDSIDYKISSTKEFTKPKIQIHASAQTKNQKQTIRTEIDFEKLVDRAKFALFMPTDNSPSPNNPVDSNSIKP